MPLLSIKVVAPISACSTKVRVEGQLTGAMVRVLADGDLVAEGEANSASDLFDLLPGVNLQGGQSLVATQSFQGETSPPSPEPLLVQAPPPELGFLQVGELLICGECVHVGGALPGIVVSVHSGGGQSAVPRGESDIVALTSQVEISPPAEPQETLVVRPEASACGLSGEAVPIIAGFPPPGSLPPPLIERPLKACTTVVRFSGVYPGATVTLQRGSGEVSGCVAGTGGYWLIAPLETGEALRIRQAFPRCDVVGSFSDSYIVEPPEPIKQPVFSGEFSNCAGTLSVFLRELIPTAQFRLLRDGSIFGVGEVPPNQTFIEIPVEPLAAGSILTAQQNLCGIWGPVSEPMQIREQSPNIPPPEIEGPLFPCAAAVRVRTFHGSVRVTVFSSQLGAPIGQGIFQNIAGYVDVPVSPLLLPGDTLHAALKGCGDEAILSANETVATDTAAVDPPLINQNPPLQVEMTSVPVMDVIPGAYVDAIVNGEWRGGNVIGGTTGHVSIIGALALNDAVLVRQRICARTSASSDPAFVQHKLPIAAFTANPESGMAPLEVQFSNQSSNANHPTTPYRWMFNDQGGDFPPDSTAEAPSHTYASDGSFLVTLEATNASGFSHAASRTATVAPADPDRDPDPGDDDGDDEPEIEEQEVIVSLERQAIFEGNVPYLGYSGPLPGTILTRIENPSNFSIRFLKVGHSTDDCGDADAVVVVQPHGEIGSEEFEELWEEAEPPGAYPGPSGFGHIGRFYPACVGTTAVSQIPHLIQIRAYFVPAS